MKCSNKEMFPSRLNLSVILLMIIIEIISCANINNVTSSRQSPINDEIHKKFDNLSMTKHRYSDTDDDDKRDNDVTSADQYNRITLFQ